MNRKEFKRQKRNQLRSAMSNKIINGREVILTSEVFDYVLKMGYKLSPANKQMALPNKAFILGLFLILSANLVSASMFTLDLAEQGNQLLYGLFLVLGLFFYFWTDFKYWGAFMFFLSGVLVVLNGYNLIIGMFLMAIGLFMFIKGDK